MPGVNVKGPKNGKYVKAKFIGSSLKGRKDLKKTSILLLTSIKGNPYCTGDSYAASLQNAIKQHGKVTCLIVDAPHWHNLRAEDAISSDEELQQEAIKLGDQWWQANEKAFINLLNSENNSASSLVVELSGKEALEKIETFNRLAIEKKITCNVLRWNDWIKSGNCDAELKHAEEKYNSVETLKNGVENTASEFTQRHNETYKEASKNYLTTECPRIMIIGAKLDYNFIAYPGDISSVLTATYEYFVKPNNADKMQWLRIDFKRSNEEPKQETKFIAPQQETKPQAAFILGTSHNFFVDNDKTPFSQTTYSFAISYEKVEQLIFNNVVQTMSMLPLEAQSICRQHLIDLLTNFSPERSNSKLADFQTTHENNLNELPKFTNH